MRCWMGGFVSDWRPIDEIATGEVWAITRAEAGGVRVWTLFRGLVEGSPWYLSTCALAVAEFGGHLGEAEAKAAAVEVIEGFEALGERRWRVQAGEA